MVMEKYGAGSLGVRSDVDVQNWSSSKMGDSEKAKSGAGTVAQSEDCHAKRTRKGESLPR